MKIGLLQYAPVWESPAENVVKISRLLAGKLDDLDLLIFPEMTLTGFTMQSQQFAEESTGQSFAFFAELARTHKVHVLAGLIEKAHGKIYNSLTHFNDFGDLGATYRKIHPFSFAGEDKHYSAGDKPVIIQIEGAAIGLSICYDLRFPELYRLYAKECVTALVNIANWPAMRSEHWVHLLKARAIENQCYMIGVNRVGNDPQLEYNGNSAVYGPLGNEVMRVENSEGLLTVELELSAVDDVRATMPFLNDIKLI